MKKFYDAIAGTISKEYLLNYKCPLILDFVSDTILVGVTIGKQVQTSKKQPIPFSTLSYDVLLHADENPIEVNLAEILVELLY